MRDPHQNIFYYYRGPSKRNKDSLYDIQIEDNTTKSLINKGYISVINRGEGFDRRIRYDVSGIYLILNLINKQLLILTICI